jgi:uncharacterized surface protein with fasciclin (FAS1) repeats
VDECKALAAGSFTTLAAALRAAGLVDTLKLPGRPFTVFAPTDAAFAKLPPGTLDELLKPENKDKLAAFLKNVKHPYYFFSGKRTVHVVESAPRAPSRCRTTRIGGPRTSCHSSSDTGGKAEAWCLPIHAYASSSL